MITDNEYAQLAGRVYNRPQINRIPVPTKQGWREIQYIEDNAITGFSAGVYKRGEEIVISYTGTNERKVADFLLANLPAGAYHPSIQVGQAIQLYLQVKRDHPTAKISFTGHSLGGGIASVMAVLFNKPAVVFDHAPFELSTRFLPTLHAYKLALGINDKDFNDYLYSIDFEQYSQRERNVRSISVQNEALSALRFDANTISGSHLTLRVGAQSIIDSGQISGHIDLHSMSLLASMQLSDAFKQSIPQNKYLLELIFKSSLYANDPALSDEENFLDKLYINQVNENNRPNLDRFGADMMKLGSYSGTMTEAMHKALIAQALDWYYAKEDATRDDFFRLKNGLLQYTTATGARITNAKNKAEQYVNKWLTPKLNNLGVFGGNLDYEQWNIGISESSVNGAFQDIKKSQFFLGSSGSDKFSAGEKNDFLVSGDGSDSLSGGAGDDTIYGEAGDDTIAGGDGTNKIYGGDGDDKIFSRGNDTLEGGSGSDTYIIDKNDKAVKIKDSDRAGSIIWRDINISGGIQELSNNKEFYYATSPIGTVRYRWNKDSGTLTVTIDNQLGSLLVESFNNSDLNINLGVDLAINALTGQLYMGDQRPAEIIKAEVNPGSGNFIDAYAWENPVYDISGVLLDGVFVDSFEDVIYGTSGSDIMHGGNAGDALDGSGGDDSLYGDSGGDLLVGGSGSDHLEGNAGDDFLIKAGHLTAKRKFGPETQSLTSEGVTVASGTNWRLFLLDGIYKYTGVEIDFISDLNSGKIFGGKGNDFIYGAGGDDEIDSGADADLFWEIDIQNDNDTVQGLGGNDQITTGVGDDVVYGDKSWVIKNSGESSTDLVPLIAHGDDVINSGLDNDYVSGDGGADYIDGGSGQDTLYGDFFVYIEYDPSFENFNDTIYGNDGGDKIYGGWGNDILVGGQGDDWITGDKGSDTYQYNLGDGNDTIQSSGLTKVSNLLGEYYILAENDYLELGQEFDPNGANVSLIRRQDVFVIGEEGSEILDFKIDFSEGGSITIENANNIGINFSKTGTFWHLADLINHSGINKGGGQSDLLGGTAYSDTIEGNGGGDRLDGGNGDDLVLGGVGNAQESSALIDSPGASAKDIFDNRDDLIYGGRGNDTIDGGSGSDWISDDLGNDVYILKPGSSWDAVSDSGPEDQSYDAIEVRGVTQDDVTLSWDYGIRIKGTNDAIHFDLDWDVDNPSSYGIEEIRFDDGKIWNRHEIYKKLNLITSGADKYIYWGANRSDNINLLGGDDFAITGHGDDTIDGGTGDDTISSISGNDDITGGPGDDVLDFGKGSNVFRYNWGDGNDSIYGGDYVTSEISYRAIIGSGISADDIEVWIDADDAYSGDRSLLFINRGPAGGTFVFKHAISRENATKINIGDIKFSDGRTWTQHEILSMIKGTYSKQNTNKHYTALGYGTKDYAFSDWENNVVGSSFKIGSGLTVYDNRENMPAGRSIYLTEDINRSEFAFKRIERHLSIKLIPTQDELVFLYFFNEDGSISNGSSNITIISPAGVVLSTDDIAKHATSSRQDSPISPGMEVPPHGIYAAQGSLFSYSFSKDTFVDPDAGDKITYDLSLANQNNLPSWLSWDSASRTIVGLPTLDVAPATLNLLITGFSNTQGLQYSVPLIVLDQSFKPPVLKTPQSDIFISSPGTHFSYQLPITAFIHPEGKNMSYTVTLADGAPLSESWLHFDEVTRTFSGIAQSNKSVTVRLTATDSDHLTAHDEFNIIVPNIGLTLTGGSSNDFLIGTDADDTLLGSGGSDTLSGGLGRDFLEGGAGNDSYYFNEDLDDAIEIDGGGWDTIISTLDVTLPKYIEALDLSIATRKINGLGNDLPNVIRSSNFGGTVHGLDGNDTLISGSRAGSLFGGEGDDLFIIGSSTDLVVEKENEGHDTIEAGVSFRLTDNIEVLRLLGSDDITGIGTDHGDHIIGNAGRNFLNGGKGSDTLEGGLGADTYLFGIGSQNDFIRETDSDIDNIDIIELSIYEHELGSIERIGSALVLLYGDSESITIEDYFSSVSHEIEEIRFLGGIVWDESIIKSRITTRGDSQANLITGASEFTNQIFGLSGDDTLIGGSRSDMLFGDQGDDWLIGSSDSDVLFGGDGSDLYVTDSLLDQVIEFFDISNPMASGMDTVYANSDYVLPFNVETLILEGSSNLSAWSNNSGGDIFGNEGNNHIYGGDWDDFLSGGYGEDTLIGGYGDDFYELIDGADVIIEGTDEGYDFIWTYTSERVSMADNVEELVHKIPSLFGLNAIGNSIANVITSSNGTHDKIWGGDGNDTIRAKGGNDQLHGEGGNDHLEGGTGSDHYFFAVGDGQDRILDSQISATVTAVDKITFEGEIKSSHLWFHRQTNDLVINLIGTTDSVTIRGWYLNNNASANYQIENIRASGDGKSISNIKVDQLVQAMSAFSPPPVGQTELSATQLAVLSPTLAATWV